MSLEGKKVLFIAPKFFGYEYEIKKEMEKLGAKVSYYDERPQNSNMMKALIRLNLKKIVKKKIDEYFNNIINESKNEKYDFVFFIVPETISEKQLYTLKTLQGNAKFILYMWDSIKNKKNTKELIKYFDKIYTFDKTDLEEYKEFIFRPLFYINDYKCIREKNNIKNDICFIGTAHSDRYHLLKNIEKQAIKNNLRYFYYFYFPSKIYFWIRRVFDSNFKNVKYKDFSFKSMSKKDLLSVISESNSVIDIQHPSQTGLTMRTLEILGAGKKLITTNKEIINYDFYDENNILIIDRKNPIINLDFFSKNYNEVDNKILEKYSLEFWIKKMFEV